VPNSATLRKDLRIKVAAVATRWLCVGDLISSGIEHITQPITHQKSRHLSGWYSIISGNLVLYEVHNYLGIVIMITWFVSQEGQYFGCKNIIA